MANKQISIAPRNLLLDAFENESRERVDPYLERVEFKLGDVICEAGGILKHAYFPDGAVISLLSNYPLPFFRAQILRNYPQF